MLNPFKALQKRHLKTGKPQSVSIFKKLGSEILKMLLGLKTASIPN